MLTAIANLLKNVWAVCVKQVSSSSVRGKLCSADVAKVIRNAIFVGSSSALLFLVEDIAQNTLSSIAQGIAITVLNGVVECVFRAIRNNKDDKNNEEQL